MSSKRKPPGGMEVDLPITPMLDMAFQIFMFFAFLYHPSALEVHIDGNLLPPPSSSKKKDTPDKKEPQKSIKKDEDTRETLTVIVHAITGKDQAGSLGTPKEILLKKPQNIGQEDLDVILARKDTWEDGQKKLEDALRKILLDSTDKDNPDIDIQADGELLHEYFIAIYDICKARYGIDTSKGKKVLVKITSRKQEAKFAKVIGFQNVGFVPPPELREAIKKEGADKDKGGGQK
jgi:biopolymer transport protein ExbD